MADGPGKASTERSGDVIRSQPFDTCPVCGSKGEIFRRDLTDDFFHAPGKWSSRKCLNPRCRLVWLDPMPLEEDIHKAYKDYLISHEEVSDIRHEVPGLYGKVQKAYWASHYGYGRATKLGRIMSLAAWLHPAWKPALDVNVFFLEHVEGGRLLEIGCGAGRQLMLMRDLGWNVEGVDRDPTVVQNAVKKGLKVAEGLVYDQDYPDDSFDAIIMNHVIEHVYEPDRLVRELYRILRPGGRLVMVTPNIESLGSRIFRNFIVAFMDTPRHLYVFTGDALKLLGTGAGFGNCRVFSTARHAGYLYLTDKAIDRTGFYIVSGKPSPKERVAALALTLYESALLRVKPFAGEELVFIGRK